MHLTFQTNPSTSSAPTASSTSPTSPSTCRCTRARTGSRSGVFWALAATVFYQFFTRYALNDSASWTEEIARYLLICTVFVGASVSVRKNTHIHVDIFYRFMPARMARVLSTFVDAMRIVFFAYAAYLTWLLMGKIGKQQMAIIDWPIGIIYAFVLFGFVLMCFRAITTAIKHWRQGFSVLERPEVAGSEAA